MLIFIDITAPNDYICNMVKMVIQIHTDLRGLRNAECTDCGERDMVLNSILYEGS